MFRTARKTVTVLAATLVALGMGVTHAQAASSSLSGTVNCNGSRTTYTTVRYMAEPSRTDLYMTQSAGGARSGYSMVNGVYIVANGRYHDAFVWGANSWATLQSGNGYVRNTRFRMTAQMATPSKGTCSNAWAGTLHY